MLILVVAGDPSGDMHAAALARALKRRGCRVAAVGGPALKGVADEFLEDLASRGVTGFWEPLAKLGFLLGLARRLRAFLRDRRPAALVCVDYYGFNRRVLGLARDAGVPAFYFISPQVWASRPHRVRVLKPLVRRMLVIFPFEEKLYEDAGVPCTFVGHPLLDRIPAPHLNGGIEPPLRVGLLPGSRRSELERHLPVLLAAVERLRRHFPQCEAAVFASPTLPDDAYAAARGRAELVRESDYARRARLHLALCSSGTATLENALLGVPMVVLYRLSWLTFAIARLLIRVRHIAMANLLADKELVPELIQGDATAEKVAAAALRLLEDPRRYAALRAELAGLRSLLGRPGAAERAADAILAEART